MYYVYVLQSTIDKRLYIGKTSDLKKRFELHNTGKVKSTKPYKPWVLVYYEAFRVIEDTSKREKQLKMHAAKASLKLQISASLI